MIKEIKQLEKTSMDFEIEKLLFEQVEKPKNYLMTKIIKLWDNRYRINVFTETIEDNLVKCKISHSYFCHYSNSKLEIKNINEKI